MTHPQLPHLKSHPQLTKPCLLSLAYTIINFSLDTSKLKINNPPSNISLILMLSIAHTATGALIATKISHPLLSFPLVLASHYLLDYVLHWDVGTGLSSGKKKAIDAFNHELIDLALSAVFIWIFFQAQSPTLNYQAWFGAFVSLLPDFIEAPKNFFGIEPKWIKPLNQFHGKFHNSTPDMVKGLIPQIALLVFIAFLA